MLQDHNKTEKEKKRKTFSVSFKQILSIVLFTI